MKFNFKKILPHLVAVIAIVLVNVFYFFPQFEGKQLPMGDIISYEGMASEINNYRDKGENIQWTNSMFGGMPAYQIGGGQKNNFSRYYEKVLHLGIPRPAGYFIAGMLCMYLTLLLLNINPWVSLIISIMFGFSTGNLILYEAGHTSKIRAIMTAAPIVAGTILTLRGKYLLGGFVFTVFLAINLFVNHPQMTYYLGMALAILMVIYFMHSLRSGNIVNFGKATGVLVIGAILALGTFASKALTTLEYTEDTMRGKAILKTEGAARSSSETDGLEWNYAMNWSNGFIDLIASYIPKVAGGGSVESLPKDSNFAKAVRSRTEVQAPIYFGKLPSTAGPLYFGVVLFYLFFLGLFGGKHKSLRLWLGLAVLLTFLLSLGMNLEWFNKIFYNYFPMYNKFRTPNSVISISGVLVAILAGITLNDIVKAEDRSRWLRPLMIGTGVLGVFTLVIALMGSSFFSLDGAYDSQIGDKRLLDALMDDRVEIMRSSALRSLLFIVLSGAALYFYLKEKINTTVVIAILGVLGIFDLFSTGRGYLSSQDFVSERKYKNTHVLRPADKQILQDSDPHYRVHDITTDPFNSAMASYHHKTIGGYNAAKLQRIQDVIDRHISQGNQAVLNMLNTKYFIMNGQNDQAVAQRNPAALGNAWFVSEVTMVDSPNQEIAAMDSFDPANNVIMHKEYLQDIQNMNLSKNGSIELSSYHPDKLTYNSSSNSEQIAVFSEIWYGPDKGWKAYVDGKETKIMRANYLLRSIMVPAGNHEIVFEFKPQSYYTGETISLISSLLILGLGLFLGYKTFSRPSSDAA